MPRRRRRQELRRAARKVSVEAERVARQLGHGLTHAEQVEQAWLEHDDHGWCCPDCDPNHPAAITNDAIKEIETWKARSDDASTTGVSERLGGAAAVGGS